MSSETGEEKPNALGFWHGVRFTEYVGTVNAGTSTSSTVPVSAKNLQMPALGSVCATCWRNNIDAHNSGTVRLGTKPNQLTTPDVDCH